MDIVLKLRELRRLRGLSQREAARKSGVGEKTISSFESGVRIDSMKLSQLQRLLQAYGVTEAEFFNGYVEEELGKQDCALPHAPTSETLLSQKLDSLPAFARTALFEKFSLMADAASAVIGNKP